VVINSTAFKNSFMPNSKLLTKQEAADYLRVSTKTIDEYRKYKKLIGCRIGRKWLIRESELEKSLQTEKMQLQ